MRVGSILSLPWILLGLLTHFSCTLIGPLAGKQAEYEFESCRLETVELDDAYSIAIEQAVEWEEHPILVRASMGFSPCIEDLDTRVTFSFGSTGNPEIWLNVRLIENGDGWSVGETNEGVYEDPRPDAKHLDPNELRLTPHGAIRIALEHGGEEFLLNHSNLDWPMRLQLFREDRFRHTGPAIWMVSFLEDQRDGALHIFIRDETGQVVEKREY